MESDGARERRKASVKRFHGAHFVFAGSFRFDLRNLESSEKTESRTGH